MFSFLPRPRVGRDGGTGRDGASAQPGAGDAATAGRARRSAPAAPSRSLGGRRSPGSVEGRTDGHCQHPPDVPLPGFGQWPRVELEAAEDADRVNRLGGRVVPRQSSGDPVEAASELCIGDICRPVEQEIEGGVERSADVLDEVRTGGRFWIVLVGPVSDPDALSQLRSAGRAADIA